MLSGSPLGGKRSQLLSEHAGKFCDQGDDHGADKNPDKTEYLQSAQQGEEQQKRMKLNPAADHQRPNDVVNHADNRGSPHDEDDAFPEMSADHEVD